MNANINISVGIGGISLKGLIQRSAAGVINQEISLAAAKSGTLSTRTSDTAGTLTLASGHGITDGQEIDIYWSGGRAYKATVGTVSGTSVPFTGASGDVLPTATTAVTAQVRTVIDTDFDGDLLSLLTAYCPQIGLLQFFDSGDSLLLTIDMAAGEPYFWASSNGFTNPLAGDTVAYAEISQSSTSAVTAKLAALYASTS